MYKVIEVELYDHIGESLNGTYHCVCWETLDTPHAYFLNKYAAEDYKDFRNKQT